MKAIAIMQPYFLPYIGYFQLISAVDAFILYDNIKYTKKGWINRNRLLQNGQSQVFSLPLRRDSDRLDVCQRELAPDFNRDKLLNRIRGAYGKAPKFMSVFPVIENIVRFEDSNLFRYLHHSIVETCNYLNIRTEIKKSSEFELDKTLRGQERVIALCVAAGATTYVNAIGGRDIYSNERFRENGIELKFIQTRPFEYEQFGAPFVPWLSIIDVMMFNSLGRVQSWISSNFELI